MKLEISAKVIIELLEKQLSNFFIAENWWRGVIYQNIFKALDRVEYALSNTFDKYFWKEADGIFSTNHSGQYALFLYYLGNLIGKEVKYSSLAAQIYYLNKIMHGVDWFYEIELPSILWMEHPVGSVLGRAIYGEHLFIYQGTTVGGSGIDKAYYPVIGNFVTFYSNSAVLGKSNIGNYVILSAGTRVVNENIPDYSYVFGQSPNLIIHTKDINYMKNKYKQFWKDFEI